MITRGLFQVSVLLILATLTEIYVDAVKLGRQKNVHKTNEKINLKNTQRIIGGTEANPDEFPYQVGVLLDGVLVCGGTLLSSQHVLTSARCPILQNTTVLVKSVHLKPADQNSIEKTVSTFVIHPEFNKNRLESDIAIITLAEPVDDNIPKVQLEAATSPVTPAYVGSEATVVGWGTMLKVLTPNQEDFTMQSNSLMKTKTTIIDTIDCGLFYDEASFSRSIALYTSPAKHICITSFTGNSACNGDDGGPLLVDGKQVGIRSHSIGCGDPRYPGVYTRIRPFLPWIESIMKESRTSGRN